MIEYFQIAWMSLNVVWPESYISKDLSLYITRDDFNAFDLDAAANLSGGI